jgi:ubiquinone/menaquinone biosynthesis C-methylase UbiE
VNIQKLFSRKSPLQRLQLLYKSPVVDLGDVHEQFRGIYSPGYEASLVKQYMTGQFREDASTYVQRYQKTDYFENLLVNAFARVGLHQTQRTRLNILDIGSGAGNSVFPLLKLCPQSSVIASDLSAELLVLLKDFLQQQHLDEDCLLFQLNAEELNFADQTFDLVVGAATLHHLFQPEKTIEGCARILKTGGHAIFFEPFENGHALLRLAYQDILRDWRSNSLAEESRLFLTGRIQETELRQRRDKSHPEFATVDDKWFFTRQFFEEFAELHHFSDCIIYPLYPLELVNQQFVLQTEINLRILLRKERGALPDWAWQIIERYDEAFSEDLKKELLLEGTVILAK